VQEEFALTLKCALGISVKDRLSSKEVELRDLMLRAILPVAGDVILTGTL
jgi:hypothetical protein